MKDWKTWVLLLGIYLLVKMCGGCNSCNSDSSSSQAEYSSKEITGQTCSRCGEKTTTPKFLGSNPYCPSCYEARRDWYESLYGNPPVKARRVN